MKKSRIIFRRYDSFGYIVDIRGYGYRKIDAVGAGVGDKILSESGSVFFSVLERSPQAFDDIVAKVVQHFDSADAEVIRADAKEFYGVLERDGFVVIGETLQECEEKDFRFSYKTFRSEVVDGSSSLNYLRPETSTGDFFEKYFDGKPQLRSLHVEVTSRCNERCEHCYIPHERKKIDIDSWLFREILDQCRRMRLLHLTLSGGEPMLHKDFCEFLRLCRESDFSVNVLSNLTLLDSEIVNEMKKNPMLGVQVSLYSMDEDVHDKITQLKGSFQKTQKGIFMLLDNDIPLQISCPIIKQNKDCYDDVRAWGVKHNVFAGDDFVVIGTYDGVGANLGCRLSVGDVEDVILNKALKDEGYLEKIKEEAEKRSDIKPSDFICSVCSSSLCVAENGNVYPCAGWQGYVVGNVKETSLDSIWDNAEKIRSLRNLRRYDFPECVQCSDKEYCTMCMVRNANESPSGDCFEINKYFCEIVRFNKRLVLGQYPVAAR